jgi:hypothetical protein
MNEKAPEATDETTEQVLCFHCEIIALLQELEDEGSPVHAEHLLSSLIQLAGEVIKDAPEEMRPMLLAMSVKKLADHSGAITSVIMPGETGKNIPAEKKH